MEPAGPAGAGYNEALLHKVGVGQAAGGAQEGWGDARSPGGGCWGDAGPPAGGRGQPEVPPLTPSSPLLPLWTRFAAPIPVWEGLGGSVPMSGGGGRVPGGSDVGAKRSWRGASPAVPAPGAGGQPQPVPRLQEAPEGAGTPPPCCFSSPSPWPWGRFVTPHGRGGAGAAAAPGWLRICCRLCWSTAPAPCAQALPCNSGKQEEMLISATSTDLPSFFFFFCCFPAVPNVPVQGLHSWGPEQSRGLWGGRERAGARRVSPRKPQPV